LESKIFRNMKKHLSIMPFLFLFSQAFPQYVKRIEDPHIRAQQNRMVFKNWGNFMPHPKSEWWSFGKNVNVHHTLTWGWLAPRQNKRYKDGPDIRPLGPTGEQTQRMALNTAMLDQSNTFKKHAEELGKTALSELANHTGGMVSELDPLWMLYYKRVLRDVKDYDLSVFTEGLTPKQKAYMDETGLVEWLDEEMARLSERLNAAFSTTMDRGARILNYHRIFLEYEKLLNQWQNHAAMAETLLILRERAVENRSGNDLNATVWNTPDERELMAKIIDEAKKL